MTSLSDSLQPAAIRSSTQTIAKLVTNLQDSCLKSLHEPHKDMIPDHIRIREQLGQVLESLRVESGQTSFRVETGRGVKLADLLPWITKNVF